MRLSLQSIRNDIGGATLVVGACAVLLGAGCLQEDPVGGDPGTRSGLGETCEKNIDCQSGLFCSSGAKCARGGDPGTTPLGGDCGAPEDCQVEYTCNSLGKCALPGKGQPGDSCVQGGHAACAKGFVCSAALKCVKQGAPGGKLSGSKCSSPTDCAFGLLCILEQCEKITVFTGETCKAADKAGSVVAHFEVPRGGKKLADYYRLPFPNDIRKSAAGKIDVKDFPNPATVLPKRFGDIVKAFFETIGNDLSGFGVNTAAHLRFSGQIDFDTLTLQGAAPTLRYRNITKGSAGYGRGISYRMFANSGRGKYICHNWVAVRPRIGVPLDPNATYAVIMTNGIKDSEGGAIKVDDDFKTMMADNEPSDADLKAAWTAYKPLRDYLKDAARPGDKDIDATQLLNAAVFTTMNPREKMAKFRAAVRAEAAPVLASPTLCDGSAKTPCDNKFATATHKCPTAVDAAFDEIQGTYKAPVFQTGKPPYKTEGGVIEYDSSTGAPKKDRDEDACVALTIPKGTMPAGGWPVVLFAHGTGGSYRSGIENGTAKALATHSEAKMAMIAVDGSMHGPRRGVDEKPDELFFNLFNPRAARDNVYQGAAEKMAVVRLIETINLTAASSPTKNAIKFDTSKIYFFGHSQGTVEGIPMLPFEKNIAGTVLSGAGGYLINSFLGKKKPVDISARVKVALAELQTIETHHPLLNLLQLIYEEVDSLNYGRQILNAPVANEEPKHWFLSYGDKDSFTPPSTIDALVTVSGLPLLDQSKTPLSGNLSRGGKKYTGVYARYSGATATPPYDDHFVIFRNTQARDQSLHFLGSAAKNGIPTVPKK